MDRLPADELDRILKAARRVKASDLILLRLAIHGEGEHVMDAIRKLEGKSPPKSPVQAHEDHAELVKGIQKILGAPGRR